MHLSNPGNLFSISQSDRNLFFSGKALDLPPFKKDRIAETSSRSGFKNSTLHSYNFSIEHTAILQFELAQDFSVKRTTPLKQQEDQKYSEQFPLQYFSKSLDGQYGKYL